MKKGIANIYWLVMAIAVILIMALAWISTTHPVQYTAETGREQSVFFNSYVVAEEIRNYAEESARLSTFHCLRKYNISTSDPEKFNALGTSLEKDAFCMCFGDSLNNYMESHPMENTYSELIPPTYGRFIWEQPASAGPYGSGDNTTSILYAPTANTLRIMGSSNGDIQVINNRYTFMYFADGSINLNVTWEDYRQYQSKLNPTVDNFW